MRNLFGDEVEQQDTYLNVVPLSIIDLPHKNKKNLINKDFDNKSSRDFFSEFPSHICELVYGLFLKNSTTIIDPFAGWGERHYFADKYNKKYFGYDLSKDAIDNAKYKYGCENFNKSFLDETDLKIYDGFFTCPPYWNLEVYNNETGLDKHKTWEDFLIEYEKIIEKSIRHSKVGSKFCIVTGDWRMKNVYYDLTYETARIFKTHNCSFFDNVIISRKNNTKISILVPQAKRLGYTVKLHETLQIFTKNG